MSLSHSRRRSAEAFAFIYCFCSFSARRWKTSLGRLLASYLQPCQSLQLVLAQMQLQHVHHPGAQILLTPRKPDCGIAMVALHLRVCKQTMFLHAADDSAADDGSSAVPAAGCSGPRAQVVPEVSHLQLPDAPGSADAQVQCPPLSQHTCRFSMRDTHLA